MINQENQSVINSHFIMLVLFQALNRWGKEWAGEFFSITHNVMIMSPQSVACFEVRFYSVLKFYISFCLLAIQSQEFKKLN